jgi:uncharacterized protein
MKNDELQNLMIFEYMRGSTAYGTTTEHSDIDIGGVCLPPPASIFGNEKFQTKANGWVDDNGEKQDKEVHSLSRYVELALDNNPNIIEYMFAPGRCVLKSTPYWERLVAVRDSFVSKKCAFTFQAYASNQLKRIETHRGYLLNPITSKPERGAFGLSENSIFPATQLDAISRLSGQFITEDPDGLTAEMTHVFNDYSVPVFRKYANPELLSESMNLFKTTQKSFLHMLSSISGTYLKDEYIDMASKELSYLTKLKEWKTYKKWEKTRNKERAVLEVEAGYDTKHASHLIRLSRMGMEILDGKGVIVDRTDIDADYLLAIRQCKIPFEDVLAEGNRIKAGLDEAYNASTVQKSPDREYIRGISTEIIMEYSYDYLKKVM